ncbi:hypothetical protein CBR_g36860 [Chara braunii]|uniref:Uncharacterized protein n=1 Tax=Chara braunii TaxID=69332 RepID=A0A388LLZ1_CHABU|nr:hypothetical protein CBR_g36860 [Chara braunii]|eukprot:GBG83245.1 hypothetical protein CBR_g36860 [Chara braunii]
MLRLSVQQKPTFTPNGWYTDLVQGAQSWLDNFKAPSRPAQTLIALANPVVLEFVRANSFDVSPPYPPLLSILRFNDWADLIWAASYDATSFPQVTRDFVERAKDMVDGDILTHVSIVDELALKEKVFVDLWGAKSAFHDGLVTVPVTESYESDSDCDGLDLAEEEKRFHAAELAKTQQGLSSGIAKDKRKSVSKYMRNVFLPLAPSRWIESESAGLNDKVWELETINHSAPISIRAYQLLASITEAEMDFCLEKALNEDTELIKGPYPFGPDAMDLPSVGQFDRSKCSVSGSQLQIRSFCAARSPDVISELKRIWNVGRPFLKCRCIEEGKEDCKTTITWFDHILWYLLANIDFLYSAAPSLRARIRVLRNLLKKKWRAPVLASIVFSHMRRIMAQMAENVISNPCRRQGTIHDVPAIMARKFPRKMAVLILPDKYIKSPARKRKVQETDKRPTKRQSNTLLSYYVRPSGMGAQQDQGLGGGQQVADLASPNMSSDDIAIQDTPQSSVVTVQSEHVNSVVGKQLRRNPRN